MSMITLYVTFKRTEIGRAFGDDGKLDPSRRIPLSAQCYSK